jgi:hypothetical protein
VSDIVLAVAYQTFDAGFDIVAVETVLPTGLTIARYPLAMAVNLGYTAFLGPNRDALSFEYFFESGLALEADLSRKNLAIRSSVLVQRQSTGKI